MTDAPLEATAGAADVDPRTRGALNRYRVMAFVTGTFLLIVCLDMVLKYVVKIDNPTFLEVTSWIAIVHGWIYIIYLITVVQLWLRQHWALGRLFTMALGGVVPFLSFVVERKVAREVLSGSGAAVGAEENE